MKKRLLAMFLALVMMLALLPTAALAADSDFIIENGVLTAYTGPGGDVTIPDGVTSIGDAAFADCPDMTGVTIPDSVTSIGNNTFAGCDGLTSVTIPGSVAKIGWGAFFSCSGLKTVTFSKGVTSIGEYAFQDCVNLSSVGIIPDSVTSIENGAFICCFSLAEIQVDPENPVYASVDGVLLTKDLKTVVMCPCGKQGAYTIPDGVTAIGDDAFEDCQDLTSVTIPASVTSIGSMAFFDCESLTSVTIPDGVTSIGSQTFSYSTSLTSVTIPSSVTGIEGNAFLGSTGLKDVYYGGSEAQWAAIKSGEAYSFRDDLTNATIHYNSTGPETPSTLPTVEDIPATGTAVAQTQNVLLDGKTVQFQNYAVKDANGNMTNYVKIRDLGKLLNFNVTWNGSSIVVESDKPYTG